MKEASGAAETVTTTARRPDSRPCTPPGVPAKVFETERVAIAAACAPCAWPAHCLAYRERLSAAAVADLPVTGLCLSLYGQEQLLRLRSVVARARFLKGTPVRAVWCQFFDARKKTWTKPRLLLATETELTAESTERLYARRCWIEPLFHNLKRWWDISNLWQQSGTALELWMQIRSTAWTVAQLLSPAAHGAFPMEVVAPWRMKHPLTAGLVALAAHGIYRTCLSRWLRPQIAEIRLSGTALRPSLEAVALHLFAAVRRSSQFRRPFRLIAARHSGW